MNCHNCEKPERLHSPAGQHCPRLDWIQRGESVWSNEVFVSELDFQERRMNRAAELCANQAARLLRLANNKSRMCPTCNGEIFQSGSGHAFGCNTRSNLNYIGDQEAKYGH